MVLLALASLAGVWWLLQDAGRDRLPRNAVAEADEPAIKPAPAKPSPGQPDAVPTPSIEQPNLPEPTPVPEFATPPEPALHQPDYGPRLLRGGARIEFELADAKGATIPVQYCSVTLWRQLGSYWLKEECEARTNGNAIFCNGLGDSAVSGAGLEPGDYELDIFSNRYGALRHRFVVRSGEKRRERLLMPNWTRTICFNFVHPDGSPVLWIKTPPTVTSKSAPLPAMDRPAGEFLQFRTAPTDPPRADMGSGWGGSTFSPTRRMRGDSSVYPTDNGRYYVRVWAGAENTVSFPLGTLWGMDYYTVANAFTETIWEETKVTLPTVADFADQVADTPKRKADPPGGRQIIAADEYNEFTRPPEDYDPLTAPLKPAEQRLVVRVQANFEPRVEISYDGKSPRGQFNLANRLWYSYFNNQKPAWFRVTDGVFFTSPWERVPDLAPGVVTEIERSFSAALVTVTCGGLSPTLQAFAHTVDFDIGLTKPRVETPPGELPRIIEDTDIEEGDPTDMPTENLAPNPNIKRNEKPEGGRVLRKIFMRQKGDVTSGELRFGRDSLVEIQADDTLTTRVHLRGVSRYARESNGNARFTPDARDQFTPITLNGRWLRHEGDAATLLRGGTIQPHLDDAFCLRVIGNQGEGLPWVTGLVFEYANDEVAQQVRQILARRPAYPEIAVSNAATYKASLEQLEAYPDQIGMRELIGDSNYELFETDAQRLWFARNGAWYSAQQTCCSDEHGYIATQGTRLEPGKVYVLYLWSQSRNDIHPDNRIVFKAGQGVTDLGAISLPSYR